MIVRECLKQMNKNNIERDMFIELVNCNKEKVFDYHATPAKMLFHLPTFLLNSRVIGIYAPYFEIMENGEKIIIRRIMIQIIDGVWFIMSEKKIKIESTDEYSRTSIFEIARNIYDENSFINNHITDFITINGIINKYNNSEFHDLSAELEFNNGKVNILYTIFGKKPIDSIIIELDTAIKNYFPIATKIYDSQSNKFASFGENFLEDSNNG